MPYKDPHERREYHRRYYAKNKQKWDGYNEKYATDPEFNAKRRVWSKASYERWKAIVQPIIAEAKRRGCLYCPESDEVALDFHHRDRTQKRFNIGRWIKNGVRSRIQDLIDEIAKCDVVCSNCHRKFEAGRTLVPRS